jgi:hypothetical protein
MSFPHANRETSIEGREVILREAAIYCRIIVVWFNDPQQSLALDGWFVGGGWRRSLPRTY